MSVEGVERRRRTCALLALHSLASSYVSVNGSFSNSLNVFDDGKVAASLLLLFLRQNAILIV